MEKQYAKIKQPLGAYVGGNITADNVTVTVNPSPSSTGQAFRHVPFRFNIPTPTRHFQGRENILEDIQNYFGDLPPTTSDCWDRVVAIVGLGGMGKTETAHKFAAQYKNIYPNVAWINAETKESALQSFLGLAKHLAIVSKDNEKADLHLVNEVYCHIDREDNGGVLFIFDNAIQLKSDGSEFGILEYLPTNELPNRRFPNILITTQTHDWGRQINTFQVDELSKEQSLEFFHSCFKTDSVDCDELFKKLHDILQGYPLAMNLAASQIDFNPKKDSVHQLQMQINRYIKLFEKDDNKSLSAKMNRLWPTKYNKTLATVWQLTFERLEQEDNGHYALEILQIMSLLWLPIQSENIVKILIYSSGCPHPADKELEFRLRESFRLLQRFYTVRTFKTSKHNVEKLSYELGIHRLIQLVVRQQMDCNRALERVLCYIAQPDYHRYKFDVNIRALEELLPKAKLGPLALPYVGILACKGIHQAGKIVETRKHETEAGSLFWHLYNLERGMTTLNETANEVLRELVELTKPGSMEQWMIIRKCCAYFIINVLLGEEDFSYTGPTPRFRLDSFCVIMENLTLKPQLPRPLLTWNDQFQGIEELVGQLILSACSLDDGGCESGVCRRRLSYVHIPSVMSVAVKLSKSPHIGTTESSVTFEHLADIWFAIFDSLKNHVGDQEHEIRSSWTNFWGVYWLFHSNETSKSRIAELRTCLWNRGLAKELIQMCHIFVELHGQFTQLHRSVLSDWGVLQCMEYCLDGMDLWDERVQEVISVFFEMIETFDSRSVKGKDYWTPYAIYVASIWVKLLLMDLDPPSPIILKPFIRLGLLDWMKRNQDIHRESMMAYSWCFNWEWNHYDLRRFNSEYFPQFIQRYSSSEVKEIKTLVAFCRLSTETTQEEACELWRSNEKSSTSL